MERGNKKLRNMDILCKIGDDNITVTIADGSEYAMAMQTPPYL